MAPRGKRRSSKKIKGVKLVMSDDAQTQQITKISRQVAKLTKAPELKYQDTIFSTSIAYDFANEQALATIIQGDGQSERIGDKIKPFSLQIRGYIYQAAAVTSPQIVRLIVLQAKKSSRFVPNLATGSPTAGGVLTNQNSTDVVNGSYFNANRHHFNILYDTMMTFSAVDAKVRKFRINKKIMTPIQYEPGTTTPDGGMIYIASVSTAASGAGNTPQIVGHARLYYSDC